MPSLLNNIIYIVSGKLDYKLLICADAGPEYAINLGWQWDYVANAAAYLNKGIVMVIDTRLEEEEYELLQKLIDQNEGTEFIAAVTDPYFEECIDKPLYKFLFKTTTATNIRYLTQYQPTEIIAFLENTKGPASMIVLNYPYIKTKQHESKLMGRKNKIIFSGSISSSLYPERYQFWKCYTRSVWRLKIDTLVHPGYPGSGTNFAHNKVRSGYVEHLSKYKFMFLSASRCNLEFMKYSECAYAGCIPVGYSPATFDDRLKKYILPIEPKHLTKSLLKIFSIPEAELRDIATGYRNEISLQRDPGVINQKFQNFLVPK